MNRFVVAGSRAAFSLVEVVLAIGVTSFCLIALIGILSVGLRSNQNTIDQAGASAVLSAAVSDLYATPATTPPGAATTSLQLSIAIPANPVTSATPVTTLYFSSSGLSTNATAAQSAYRLTVTPITNAASSTSPVKTATFLDVKVTWPAAATLANAAGAVETFVALNRN
jgi:uncharacterized protein (TIGR02598 family)